MEDWIVQFVEWGGYWGIALLMLLETVFPPVPSEVIMTVAGVSAARGPMTLSATILAGSAGAMVGNYFWYWLAIRFGDKRMEQFIANNSRWLTLEWSHVERGERLFKRHGAMIVLVGRMIPTLRSLISIPAGLFKLSLPRFLVFSAIGTVGWSGALAGAGYFLGSQVADIDRWLGPISTGVIVVIVALYLWRLLTWKPKA